MRRFIPPLAFALALAVMPLWSNAFAAGDIFSVGGIHVDASGPSASVAQLSAMAQGRPKAWTILYKRITKQQDWGRQPKLDDASLQRIIRSFTVKNEKRVTLSARPAEGTDHQSAINYNSLPGDVRRTSR